MLIAHIVLNDENWTQTTLFGTHHRAEVGIIDISSVNSQNLTLLIYFLLRAALVVLLPKRRKIITSGNKNKSCYGIL